MTGRLSNVHTGQHFFTPVYYSNLRSQGRKPIHQFLRDREQCLLHVNNETASGENIKTVSINASYYLDLL